MKESRSKISDFLIPRHAKDTHFLFTKNRVVDQEDSGRNILELIHQKYWDFNPKIIDDIQKPFSSGNFRSSFHLEVETSYLPLIDISSKERFKLFEFSIGYDSTLEEERFSIFEPIDIFTKTIEYSSLGYLNEGKFLFVDHDLEVKNKYAIIYNLKFQNFIYKLLTDLGFEFVEIDFLHSQIIYKYGFKLENWQFWDEEADDLFPNTADLIEAELDGKVDEVFYQSLPRIEQMMNEEIEKQRKFSKDKIDMLQRNKRDNWEIEQTKKQFERIEKYYRDSLERRKNTKVEKPDWLTPEQLQEIRDLIAENRKLKEEMTKKREELNQISNDLDSSEATEAGDIQVEDKKLDSEKKLQTVQKQNDKPNKKSLLQRLLYHMRYNQILNIVTKTVTYLYIAFFLLVLLRFISSFLIVFFPGNNLIFALLLSLNYFVNYYLFDIGIIIFIVALIILFLNFLIYQKIQKILIAFSFGAIPILYFLSLISSTINQ